MGFDEFARELERVGNIDEYAPELLNAAAPTLLFVGSVRCV